MALKNITKMVQAAQKKNELDEQFMADLEIIIKKNNRKNDRKPSKYFKPSSIGGCHRKIYYQRVEKEPDPSDASMELIGMGESGTDRHERLQNHIIEMEKWEWVNIENYLASRPHLKTKVVKKTGNEYKCYNEKYNLSFLTDGILRHKKTGQYVILEIKTEVSFKFNKRFGADKKHLAQATTYSLAFDIDKVIFLYENRDFCNKKTYLINVTQEMKNKVLGTIAAVNNSIKNSNLPEKTTDKKDCKYCNYKSYCKQDKL